VVHLRFTERVGGQGDHENRRIGRVHLAVIGIAREVGGEIAPGRGDGRLHIASGCVDVAVEVELEGDAARSEGAGGSHLGGGGGDAPELTVEGRSDGRRHRLGARARETSAYGDGREIDLRQRGYGKNAECDGPGERYRDGQQRRGDRLVHKWGRNIHALLTV